MLALTALGLMALLVFSFYQIFSMNRETARLMALAETTEKEKELAKTISNLRENANADIAAFESLGLSTEKLVPTIESIEAAGRALGLDTEITSVKREGKEGSALQVIKISLDSSGPWKGNFSLLKALENLPQRVIVESARLSQTESAWRSEIVLSLQSLD